MWLDGIKRFASRLARVRRKSRALAETSRTAPCDTEFDPTWHGDHWQNLLASPLDARHYVMEDWTYTPPQADTDDTPPPRASANGARTGSKGNRRTKRAKKKRDWEVAPTKVWRSFPSTKKSASESRNRSIAR